MSKYENIIFLKKNKSYKPQLISFGKKINICFNINNVKSPFGMELYNGKYILNIEFTNYDNNNEIYNIYNEIKSFDDILLNLCSENMIKKFKFEIPNDMLEKIKGKTYISCIKQNEKSKFPMLRTHIKKLGNNIKTIIYKKQNNINISTDSSEIKNNICRFVIEIDSLWTNETSYGFLFMLNLCQILN